MTSQAAAFSDPAPQRLEPIATGAEPEIVGPHLAEVLHDPRWRLRRGAHLGREVQPHLPRDL